MKLGTRLLRDAVISLTQLEVGLKTQILQGGRLGTNLVELGYLTLDNLSWYLAQTRKLPEATSEICDASTAEARKLLSPQQVEKLWCLPLKVSEDTFHVAAVDPTSDELADALEKVARLSVKLYVVPELRLFYYLEKYYEIPRAARYLREPSSRPGPQVLKERRRFPSELWTESAASGKGHSPRTRSSAHTKPPTGVLTKPASSASLEPRGKVTTKPPQGIVTSPAEQPKQDTIPPGGIVTLPAPTPPRGTKSTKPPQGIVASPASPSFVSFEETVADLNAATNREQVIQSVLSYASGRAEVFLALLPKRETAVGWRMFQHASLPESNVDALNVPLNEQSIFSDAMQGKQLIHRTFDGSENLEKDLWVFFQLSQAPKEAIVVPMLLRTRVVNLFYLHPEPGSSFDTKIRSEVGRLSELASDAYVRLIKRNKS